MRKSTAVRVVVMLLFITTLMAAGATSVPVARAQVTDTTRPGMSAAFIGGPPAQAQLTVSDLETGLASIIVTVSANADTVVPPFTVGTMEPVVVTSTLIDQTQTGQVEMTLTDLAGNSTTVSVSFDAGSANGITVGNDLDQAGAIVNYSPPSVNVSGETPICTLASGSFFPLGTTTVTCSSPSASTSFSVTVNDTQLPTITPPDNVTADATSTSGAVVTYPDPIVSDNAPGVTAACSPSSGSTFPTAVTTVTCTATDAAGNTASGSFTVTVQDATAPVVTVPAPMTVEATGPSGATVTYPASANDDLDGPLTPNCAPLSGSAFSVAVTTVTCTATDSAGNTASAAFTITVQDTVAPVVTVPGPVTFNATSPSGANVSFSATATDIVDGSLTPVCAPPSGSLFPVGTTTVTCFVTDAAGNVGSASASVTVIGADGQIGGLYTMAQNTPISGNAFTASGIRRNLLTMITIAQWFDDYGLDSLSCVTLTRLDLEIQGQVSRRRITADDADALRTKIDEIQSAIGCGGVWPS